jgi:hypothetical protein
MERRGRMVITRGPWVRRIPAKARRGICEQDTLISTARGSHDKQNCLRHSPLSSVKKNVVQVPGGSFIGLAQYM